MLSLLIYTFPNKVEQGSLLVSLASQQFLGCHVTLLGERCVTSKKRLRGRLGSLSAQFLAGPAALQPQTRHFTKVHSN